MEGEEEDGKGAGGEGVVVELLPCQARENTGEKTFIEGLRRREAEVLSNRKVVWFRWRG